MQCLQCDSNAVFMSDDHNFEVEQSPVCDLYRNETHTILAVLPDRGPRLNTVCAWRFPKLDQYKSETIYIDSLKFKGPNAIHGNITNTNVCQFGGLFIHINVSHRNNHGHLMFCGNKIEKTHVGAPTMAELKYISHFDVLFIIYDGYSFGTMKLNIKVEECITQGSVVLSMDEGNSVLYQFLSSRMRVMNKDVPPMPRIPKCRQFVVWFGHGLSSCKIYSLNVYLFLREVLHFKYSTPKVFITHKKLEL